MINPDSDIAMHVRGIMDFHAAVSKVRDQLIAEGILEMRNGILSATAKGMARQDKHRRNAEAYRFRPKRVHEQTRNY
jgi:hypothetical protein